MRDATKMVELLKTGGKAPVGRVVTRTPEEVHQLELLADAGLVAIVGTERGGVVRDTGLACTARLTDQGHVVASWFNHPVAGQGRAQTFRDALDMEMTVAYAVKLVAPCDRPAEGATPQGK